MERIKKKVVNPTKESSVINDLLMLFGQYDRACDSEPSKIVKWNTWLLTESFVVLKKYEFCEGTKV